MAGTRHRNPPLRVLLVEDEAADVFFARFMLDQTEFSYELTTVPDGEAALLHLKVSPKPDLLILDIDVPKIDGLRLLEMARELFGSSLNAIILSSLHRKADRDRAVALGVLAVFEKPDSKDGYTRIAQFLNRLFHKLRPVRPDVTRSTGSPRRCASPETLYLRRRKIRR
jgi:CheY-like chemotaxis protein